MLQSFHENLQWTVKHELSWVAVLETDPVLRNNVRECFDAASVHQARNKRMHSPIDGKFRWGSHHMLGAWGDHAASIHADNSASYVVVSPLAHTFPLWPQCFSGST